MAKTKTTKIPFVKYQESLPSLEPGDKVGARERLMHVRLVAKAQRACPKALVFTAKAWPQVLLQLSRSGRRDWAHIAETQAVVLVKE